MAEQDDLATLFSRNLSLNPYVASPQVQQPETPYYPSMSAHLVYHQPARPASEPPQTDQLTTEIILGRHGVDYAILSASQITLFRSADASQQMRLIELWRICPPNQGEHVFVQDLGPGTSFQQEEAIAKLRYERQMLEERMSRTSSEGLEGEDSMSDGSTSTPMPITPIQGGDGRWSGHGHVEPYMQSGYEALAQQEYERSAGRSKDISSHFGSVGGPSYKASIDPVYNTVADVHTYPNVGGDWQRLMEHRQQAMENQYGVYLQQYQHNSGEATGGDDQMMM